MKKRSAMKNLTRPVFYLALLSLVLVVTALLIVPASAENSQSNYYMWVMEVGEFNLIKMTTEGAKLWQVQFGQSLAIGVNPLNGSVWAPELKNNQLVNINRHGLVMRRIPGYRTEIIGVDPNDGGVWVGLTNEGQIAKLDATGVEQFRIPGFEAPYSITVDSRDSSVWIGDGGSRTLVKLDKNGKEIYRRYAPGFFSNAPQQIAVNPNNGSVWYTQGSGSGNSHVVNLTSNGNLIRKIEGFDRPNSVSIDPVDNSVWISDVSLAMSGAIVKLNQNGSELFRVSLNSSPQVVAVDPEDSSAWVGIEGALIKLSSNGAILQTVPTLETPVAIVISEVHIHQVSVDIKPTIEPNSINCTADKQIIPVAILTTETFDATQVDHTTVTFEGAGEAHVKKKTGIPRRHEEDVDKDGDDDLLFHFRFGETNLTCASTRGTLIGETFDGQPISGSDAIRMVPPNYYTALLNSPGAIKTVSALGLLGAGLILGLGLVLGFPTHKKL